MVVAAGADRAAARKAPTNVFNMTLFTGRWPGCLRNLALPLTKRLRGRQKRLPHIAAEPQPGVKTRAWPPVRLPRSCKVCEKCALVEGYQVRTHTLFGLAKNRRCFTESTQ